MLMADFQVIDSEVLDAMSEISNIIFGNVKTMLEEQVGLLGLSIPTVIFGRNFCTRSVGEQWIAVPLRVDEQDLDLRMCLSQNHSSTKQGVARQSVVVSV
jgi:chemotaxis protein CheX